MLKRVQEKKLDKTNKKTDFVLTFLSNKEGLDVHAYACVCLMDTHTHKS